MLLVVNKCKQLISHGQFFKKINKHDNNYSDVSLLKVRTKSKEKHVNNKAHFSQYTELNIMKNKRYTIRQ